MKYLNKNKILISACALAVVGSCALLVFSKTTFIQTPQKSRLSFSVNLNKEIYNLDEPIWITTCIKNTGMEPILINGRLALNSQFAPNEFRDYYIEITGPTGVSLDFAASVNVARLHNKHFISLGSQEAIETKPIDLHNYYRITNSGNYSIRVIYTNSFDPDNGQPAWKGTLITTSIMFTVRP